MRRVFGNREKIDLGRSNFRDFISNGSLYVDKTGFIERVLEEASRVLLFTRPRRTGKSLNLDMFRTFLDCKQDTRELFKGLYIEGSPVFAEKNSCPVIYLSIKNLRADGYKQAYFSCLMDIANYYLRDDQLNRQMRDFSVGGLNGSEMLYCLTKNIHEVYGIKPYVLIDEYDKLLMDNIGKPEYEEIREWLRNVFESALKDNPHLKKGVMVGVTRVSHESLLSGLNNLKVFDVFMPSAFDGDFSLTEEEASELLNEEQLEAAREWYNNYRVGDKQLFNLYSVLSYLEWGVLDNYWGMSGTMNMLIDLLNTERTDAISNLLGAGKEIETVLERRVSLQRLKSGNISNGAFYSFAVQTGYLTYNLHRRDDMRDIYKLRFPNKELVRVWQGFILEEVVKNGHQTDLRDIFKNIADTEDFSRRFQEFVSFQLSCHDIGKELEQTYHVLVFGLILGAGFKCSSNKERGYGRYDLWLESPEYNVIIEFKKSKKKSNRLERLAGEAIEQIDSRKYYAKFPNTMPLYKVGVGCYKAECFVKTMRHEF